MAERVIDELEAIEIADEERKPATIPVGVRHRLVQPVLEQHAVRQPRQRIVGREVPELAVGDLEAARPCDDDLLKALDLAAHQLFVVPLVAERRRALQYLDGLRGLAQHEQPVGVAEPFDDLHPVVVGVR